MPEKTQKEWEIESAADTIMRAEEIKKKPELYKAALVILKKRQSALSEVVSSMNMRKARRGG